MRNRMLLSLPLLVVAGFTLLPGAALAHERDHRYYSPRSYHYVDHHVRHDLPLWLARNHDFLVWYRLNHHYFGIDIGWHRLHSHYERDYAYHRHYRHGKPRYKHYKDNHRKYRKGRRHHRNH